MALYQIPCHPYKYVAVCLKWRLWHTLAYMTGYAGQTFCAKLLGWLEEA